MNKTKCKNFTNKKLLNYEEAYYFQHNILHLILPCSLDLDTPCVAHGPKNIKKYDTTSLLGTGWLCR